MPSFSSDSGVRCSHCGKLIDCLGLSMYLPSLPDPLPITCPFCGQVGTYPKSSIQSGLALKTTSPKAWLVSALVVIGLILLLAILRLTVVP